MNLHGVTARIIITTVVRVIDGRFRSESGRENEGKVCGQREKRKKKNVDGDDHGD